MKLYHFTLWLGVTGEILVFTAMFAVIVATDPIEDRWDAEEAACFHDSACDLAKLQWQHDQERTSPSPLRSVLQASLIGIFVFLLVIAHGIFKKPWEATQ